MEAKVWHPARLIIWLICFPKLIGFESARTQHLPQHITKLGSIRSSLTINRLQVMLECSRAGVDWGSYPSPATTHATMSHSGPLPFQRPGHLSRCATWLLTGSNVTPGALYSRHQGASKLFPPNLSNTVPLFQRYPKMNNIMQDRPKILRYICSGCGRCSLLTTLS